MPSSARVSHLLFALLLGATACTSSRESPTSSEVELQVPARQSVIVDYSPTVSDVGALLYLLSHPTVDVLAITLPVTGEAGCDLGFDVTFGILAMYDRDDIPVACDAERPPDAEEWPPEFLAGHESLASGLPATADGEADPRPAHQLIADTVAASDEPVVLYVVGPLTNVARALERHPELVDILDRIVIMGGAVDAAGNVEGTAAEWNFWIDVPSAARVVASGAPITLVPLDATNDVPVPLTWQSDLGLADQTAPVVYLDSLVQAFPSVTSGFFYLWDELAASVAADEGLVSAEMMDLKVVGEPGPGYGSTVRDPSGASVLVATGVGDPAGFYEHFLSILAGSAVDLGTAPGQDAGPVAAEEEVLMYWLSEALVGNVETAAEVVAPDAPWIGLGASPDVFVDGSGPYEASAIDVACTTVERVATCDVTWTDLWISANPDLDRGALRIAAEVVGGVIVAFQQFMFGADISAAYDEHFSWLSVEQPDRFQEACAADAAARTCSDLLIATADEWVASR